MSIRQPFEYSPTPGPDYIRLLYLHPIAENPAELRGTLKFHKLNEPMVYEAISYAWGEFPKFNQVIVLDGKILKITDNLYSALMAFSRPYGVRVLWADAICINQTDTTEKSQQVALMAEIYSKANLVQVWLTLHSEAAADAMKYLKDLSSRAD
ncbi:HET-domain-containing protein, partial [Paraphaeosphaeria sporulosa]